MFNSLIFCFWKKPSASRPVRVPVPETKIKNGLLELPDEGGLVALQFSVFTTSKVRKLRFLLFQVFIIYIIHHLHSSTSSLLRAEITLSYCYTLRARSPGLNNFLKG